MYELHSESESRARLEIEARADWGFTWRALERPALERSSHALAAGGRVWLIDPVDGPGLREAVGELGEPAGVIQLLDRHGRDCATLARELGAPLFRVPFEGVSGSPFSVLPVVRMPFWREAALWWPEERVLVVAEAVGKAPHYLAPGEKLAVHPALRLTPPRRLLRYAPEHLLLGHGGGLHGAEANARLREAVATSRRRALRWLAGLPRARARARHDVTGSA